MPRPHPPHTKRQGPISNFNTITYFYIYIHLHKKKKVKQYILSKDKSKSQVSQHKLDYERERERERIEIPWCCLRSGAASLRHVEGWGSYFPISLLPSSISHSPIWAKSISNLAVAELLWVFSVAVIQHAYITNLIYNSFSLDEWSQLLIHSF